MGFINLDVFFFLVIIGRMAKNYHKLGRRDDNEKQIKDYLVSNCVPFKLLDVGQGADMLVLLDRVVFLEVKNPDTSKQRQQLTPKEVEFQSLCKARGIPYFVVYTVQHVKDICERFYFMSASDARTI